MVFHHPIKSAFYTGFVYRTQVRFRTEPSLVYFNTDIFAIRIPLGCGYLIDS